MITSGEKLSNNIIKDQTKYSESINKMVLDIEKIEQELIIEAFKIPNSTSPHSPVGDESQNTTVYKNYECEDILHRKYEKLRFFNI